MSWCRKHERWRERNECETTPGPAGSGGCFVGRKQGQGMPDRIPCIGMKGIYKSENALKKRNGGANFSVLRIKERRNDHGYPF
jgi:hypothetical protein